jgi:hypothetical protein
MLYKQLFNFYYYLFVIIQQFWLVKNNGWNRHIRHYDVNMSYIENYMTLWRRRICAAYTESWKIYKWLSQRKVLVYNAFTASPIKIQKNNKTIIKFGSRPRPNSSYPTWPHSIIVYYYLFEIIQKFWLVEIIIYDIMTSFRRILKILTNNKLK